MNTTSRIPPTEFNRIIQIKSSPETIVALLNAAEERYLPTQKHANAKRVYPYWKTCQHCSQPFPNQTKEQAVRSKYCKPCLSKAMSEARKGTGKHPSQRKGMSLFTCTVCGKQFYRFKKSTLDVKQITCSKQCNGKHRIKQIPKEMLSQGRAKWTEQSLASYREKMTGPSNPAWKGGATYRKQHGNHKGAKYVRCPMEYMAMARKDGYVMEHRLIMAIQIGRSLTRTEAVHHINHDPLDNRIENLMLFATNTDHKKFEHGQDIAPLWRPSHHSLIEERYGV